MVGLCVVVVVAVFVISCRCFFIFFERSPLTAVVGRFLAAFRRGRPFLQMADAKRAVWHQVKSVDRRGMLSARYVRWTLPPPHPYPGKNTSAPCRLAEWVRLARFIYEIKKKQEFGTEFRNARCLPWSRLDRC